MALSRSALAAGQVIVLRLEKIVALPELGVFLDGDQVDRAHAVEPLPQRLDLRLDLLPVGLVERRQVRLRRLPLLADPGLARLRLRLSLGLIAAPPASAGGFAGSAAAPAGSAAGPRSSASSSSSRSSGLRSGGSSSACQSSRFQSTAARSPWNSRCTSSVRNWARERFSASLISIRLSSSCAASVSARRPCCPASIAPICRSISTSSPRIFSTDCWATSSVRAISAARRERRPPPPARVRRSARSRPRPPAGAGPAVRRSARAAVPSRPGRGRAPRPSGGARRVRGGPGRAPPSSGRGRRAAPRSGSRPRTIACFSAATLPSASASAACARTRRCSASARACSVRPVRAPCARSRPATSSRGALGVARLGLDRRHLLRGGQHVLALLLQRRFGRGQRRAQLVDAACAARRAAFWSRASSRAVSRRSISRCTMPPAGFF